MKLFHVSAWFRDGANGFNKYDFIVLAKTADEAVQVILNKDGDFTESNTNVEEVMFNKNQQSWFISYTYDVQ